MYQANLFVIILETLSFLFFVFLLFFFFVSFGPRREKTCFAICEQQRRRSACACAQSDQHLCFSLPG